MGLICHIEDLIDRFGSSTTYLPWNRQQDQDVRLSCTLSASIVLPGVTFPCSILMLRFVKRFHLCSVTVSTLYLSSVLDTLHMFSKFFLVSCPSKIPIFACMFFRVCCPYTLLRFLHLIYPSHEVSNVARLHRAVCTMTSSPLGIQLLLFHIKSIIKELRPWPLRTSRTNHSLLFFSRTTM